MTSWQEYTPYGMTLHCRAPCTHIQTLIYTLGCVVDNLAGMMKNSEFRGSVKLCKNTILGLNPWPLYCEASTLLYHVPHKDYRFKKCFELVFELVSIKRISCFHENRNVQDVTVTDLNMFSSFFSKNMTLWVASQDILMSAVENLREPEGSNAANKLFEWHLINSDVLSKFYILFF